MNQAASELFEQFCKLFPSLDLIIFTELVNKRIESLGLAETLDSMTTNTAEIIFLDFKNTNERQILDWLDMTSEKDDHFKGATTLMYKKIYSKIFNA
jgi:hypothetical protein